MKKIPTLYARNPDDRSHIIVGDITPGCEWVLTGEGVATRKYDGTCVMFDGEKWWARREVKKGKVFPAGFVEVQHDATTGKTVGWEPIEQSPFVKFWREAVEPLAEFAAMTGVPLKPGTFELIGPKINGNPEDCTWHRLERHSAAERWDLGPDATPVDYIEACRKAGTEGIVWHHPDGRMAKLKVRDIPS